MKKTLASLILLAATLGVTGQAQASSLEGVTNLSGYATIEKKGTAELRLTMLPGASHLAGHSIPVRIPVNAVLNEEDLRTGLAPRKIEYRSLRSGEVLFVQISIQPRNATSAANCPIRTTSSKLLCANGQSVGSYYRINLINATRQNGSRCMTVKSVKMTGVAKSPRRNAALCLRPVNAAELTVSGYITDTDGLVSGSTEMDFDVNLPGGVLERTVELAPNMADPARTITTIPTYPVGTRAWMVLRWDAAADKAGQQASREYAFKLT